MKTMALHDGVLGNLKSDSVSLDKKDLFEIRIKKFSSLPSIESMRKSLEDIERLLPKGTATTVSKAEKQCENKAYKGAAFYMAALPFISKGDTFLDNLKMISEFINPKE